MTTLLDNKLCKLEEAVEELNRTVKAQNNFNGKFILINKYIKWHSLAQCICIVEK